MNGSNRIDLAILPEAVRPGLIAVSLCALLFLYSAAVAAGESKPVWQPVEFALLGDMPYNADQREEFIRLMDELNAADLAFVIHAGDFWFDGLGWNETSTGLPPCSDDVMNDRHDIASNSAHPFILVPGDNEWTDCYRAKPSAYAPLERLAKLREMFYPDDKTLGKQSIKVTRQSASNEYRDFRENSRWAKNGVLFVTLHIVGSNNNRGRTEEMDAEYRKRDAANLAWLRESFKIARENDVRAMMLVAHANPQFENTWPARQQNRYLLRGLGLEPTGKRRETGYDNFLAALEEETIEFGKPVYFAHGDTHTFRIDKPLLDSFNGRLVENFTRVETFGYPDTHWIRVIIDPENPNVLIFSQEIVAENRAAH